MKEGINGGCVYSEEDFCRYLMNVATAESNGQHSDLMTGVTVGLSAMQQYQSDEILTRLRISILCQTYHNLASRVNVLRDECLLSFRKTVPASTVENFLA